MMFYGKAAAGGLPASLASTHNGALASTVPGSSRGAASPSASPITSPHRNAATRGGGAAIPSWEASLTSSSHQTRAGVEVEEVDQRNQIFAMFLFEEKVVRMEAREARRIEVEVAHTLRHISREVNALIKESEPDARASVRIAEEKCCAALVHVLHLERAVLCCTEEILRAIEMEQRRRLFLLSFEDREYKTIMKSPDCEALWRPGVHCFGACPFVAAETVCPFKQDDLYGLHMDRAHFVGQRQMVAGDARAAAFSHNTASSRLRASGDDDVIGSIIEEGLQQYATPRSSVGRSSLRRQSSTTVAAVAKPPPENTSAAFLSGLVRAR